MRGEFLPVWAETWRGIWSKLAKHADAPDDLFSELYRAQVKPPTPPIEPPAPTEFDSEGRMVRPEDIKVDADYKAALSAFATERARYVEAVSGDRHARPAFHRTLVSTVTTEAEAISALEKAYAVIDGYDVDAIRNRYFVLVEQFIETFSLRYDLRRPFTLHPTLQGIFAGLVRELKGITRADAHLHALMVEFEDAVRDLRADSSAGRIKTCIQKQVNLLEAISRRCPAITETTLGRICDQLGNAPNTVWPHNKVRDAMKNLYGFASDYPGIRHGGTPAHAIRDIEMRDMVAVTVLLAGFAPYLSHQIDSEIVYRG